MNKFLLSVHVLAAIIFVGPVTVAASMFPPIARRSLTAEPSSSGPAAETWRLGRRGCSGCCTGSAAGTPSAV